MASKLVSLQRTIVKAVSPIFQKDESLQNIKETISPLNMLFNSKAKHTHHKQFTERLLNILLPFTQNSDVQCLKELPKAYYQPSKKADDFHYKGKVLIRSIHRRCLLLEWTSQRNSENASAVHRKAFLSRIKPQCSAHLIQS